MKCEVCETENPGWSWTDTHGIAQCFICGAPYVLFHYENDKRVDKPPMCAIRFDYIPLVKKYWQEHKTYIPSGRSFPKEIGGQELANRNEEEKFYKWMDNEIKENKAISDALVLLRGGMVGTKEE